MKTHRTTEEEMEGPISFWGYKEQKSNLILPEHDDDDDDEYDKMHKENKHFQSENLFGFSVILKRNRK